MNILLMLTALVGLVGMSVGYWAIAGIALSAAYWIVVLNDVLRSEEALK